MVLAQLDNPIVQAPLAGGPSTVELAAAVCEAGALGFLAAGYRSADDVRAEIRRLRELTGRPFGVNLFVPGPREVDEEALRRYVASLGPDAGSARWDDDDWEGKVAVVREERAPVVSFTFGCPPAELVASLEAEAWVTVTSVAEARVARDAGAAALVVQGIEAGGHRASFGDGDEALGLLALLRLVAAETDLPLVAAGAIADGPAVAAALAAGAAAVQIGTGFMLADEAATHPAHREALESERSTALTRSFSGRRARSIENRFMREHGDAPVAYPQIHHATSPLRAKARERGDAEGFNLWAGQAHSLAMKAPAAEIVRALMSEARTALERARAKTDG